MKKEVAFLLLFTVLLYSSCSNQVDAPDLPESGKSGKVSFTAQMPVSTEVDITRSQASSYVDASKYVFYAFRKDLKDNVYKLEKRISDDEARFEPGNIWVSDDQNALLPIGTYKFICFYNLGAPTANSGLKTELVCRDKDIPGTTFENAQKAVIQHIASAEDVNEIFSAIYEGTGNNGVIVGNAQVTNISVALNRAVSRVDVKFVKVAANKKDWEVKFSSGTDIFGSFTGSTDGKSVGLKSIELELEGLAKEISIDKSLTNSKTTLTYNKNGSEVLIGSSDNQTAINGTSNGGDIFDKITNAQIIRGGAYFKGAYVLPYQTGNTPAVTGGKILDHVRITLEPNNAAYTERIIELNADQLKAFNIQANQVTLVTIKLQSSTNVVDPSNPGSTDGDDNEHLFNPKAQFTVTLTTLWGRVIEVEVPVQ